MTDPRAVYFPDYFGHPGESLWVAVNRKIILRNVDVGITASKLAMEKIMKTMPIWVDNLQCTYKPNLEYLLPFIIACLREYNITAEIIMHGPHKVIGRIKLSYIPLPHITSTSEVDSRERLTIGQGALSRKLIEKYLTPYIEEAYTLELLPTVLPQPIAEAIADCLMGVIARRAVYSWGLALAVNYVTAWDQEVILTYRDMFKASPRVPKIPAADSWEAAAKKMMKASE